MTGKATFGGGCFWCIEAAYKKLEGVTSATSGYAGGDTPDPSYGEVYLGSTGHAEEYIDQPEGEGAYENPIVAEVEPLEEFYGGEAKQQDYYEKNPADGYCRTYAEPKSRKARQNFETESSTAR